MADDPTALGDDEEEVEEEEPIDVDALAPDLLVAVKQNNLDKCLELLALGVPPTTVETSESNNTWGCLHWAANSGNLRIISALIDAQAVGSYKTAKDQISALEKEGLPVPPETSALLKNTPLQWASLKGHHRAVWMLLCAGYSIGDVDEVGNTALHMAAVNSHAQTVRMLLANGANAHKRNKFSNVAFDVATSNDVRNMLKDAMAQSAPTTDRVEQMQTTNAQKYAKAETALIEAINTEDQLGLEAAMQKADAVGLDPDRITEGAAAMIRNSQAEDIKKAVELVTANEPIVTQRAYTTYVNRLSRLIKKAELNIGEGDASYLDVPRAVVQKAHSEYWLKMASNKFEGVEIATEALLPHVGKLDAALEKCKKNVGEEELCKECQTLLFRLNAEIELAAALEAIPPMDSIKMPLPEYDTPKAEVQYWADTADQDNGFIDPTTEGYPLPPQIPGEEEGTMVDGEYIWVKSKTLQLLQSTNDRLQKALDNGVSGGANEGLCEAAKVKSSECSGKLKALNIKDESDHTTALEKVEKEAKKLRKKNKKK